MSTLLQDIERMIPALPGWCTVEKAHSLAKLIVERKPQLAVEIGIFGGRSLFAQAMALRSNGSGIIYGIDPFEKEAALEGEKDPGNINWWTNSVDLEKIYVGFINAALGYDLTKECRWVRGRSESARRRALRLPQIRRAAGCVTSRQTSRAMVSESFASFDRDSRQANRAKAPRITASATTSTAAPADTPAVSAPGLIETDRTHAQQTMQRSTTAG